MPSINNVTPPSTTDTDATQAPPTPDCVQVLFTAEAPPAPLGDIAKAFAAVSMEDQRRNADSFYDFLADKESNPMGLNIGSTLLSAMVCVPTSHKIKIICGLGFHSAGIGATSPLDNKFLALHGEGGPTVAPSSTSKGCKTL